jgi:hypothetical protein
MKPTGLSGVEDKPSLPGEYDPALRVFERGLGNHRPIIVGVPLALARGG